MSDSIQQMILHFSAKITEKQDEIIMQTIQEIGGETFREITIDKHKVLEALSDYVNKQKGAEVAEVKHGEWEKRGFDGHNCSVCGALNDIDTNYCPNCGAKMDGGVNHDRSRNHHHHRVRHRPGADHHRPLA